MYTWAAFYEDTGTRHLRLLQLCQSLMMAHLGPKHVEDYNNMWYCKQTTVSVFSETFW